GPCRCAVRGLPRTPWWRGVGRVPRRAARGGGAGRTGLSSRSEAAALWSCRTGEADGAHGRSGPAGWRWWWLTSCDACSQRSVVLQARTGFSICGRDGPAGSIEIMRVLIVEDEPYLAEAIRDGLRLEAIAADIAGDGDTALELLGINAYDIAVLDRDIPGPSGDEIAKRIVASGTGMPILMLTAAHLLDDKASAFGLGADDHLTKPLE